MARQPDLLGAISTKMPATYPVSVAVANYDLRSLLYEEFPVEETAVEERRFCGGETQTGHTVLRKDVTIPIRGRLYPTLAGWLVSYSMGGGAGYVVSGSTPNYLHTGKKITPNDYTFDWFSLITWFEGMTTFFEYLGCQIQTLTISAREDEDEGAVRFEGTIVTRGERLEVTSGFTEPGCSEEEFYRHGDSTVTFGPFGGSALTGLDVYGWSFTMTNTLDERPRRSGLYVASAREYGVRRWEATLDVVTEPGDAVDDLIQARASVALSVAVANPTANRVLTMVMGKAGIVSAANQYIRTQRTQAKRISLRGDIDLTNSTTKSNTPFYWSAQSGVATYRAS